MARHVPSCLRLAAAAACQLPLASSRILLADLADLERTSCTACSAAPAAPAHARHYPCCHHHRPPMLPQAQRLGGLLEPIARRWDLYSRVGRGFMTGARTLPLPDQDKLVAFAGEVAALACVVLRPGDAAADAVRLVRARWPLASSGCWQEGWLAGWCACRQGRGAALQQACCTAAAEPGGLAEPAAPAAPAAPCLPLLLAAAGPPERVRGGGRLWCAGGGQGGGGPQRADGAPG